MNYRENRPDCHKLRLLSASGRGFRLKAVEVSAFILHRNFVWSLLLFSVLLTIVDPNVFTLPANLFLRIVFWLANSLAIVALWYGFSRLLAFSRFA
ncbi:hypothetical protein RXV86_17895 [Alisedimentitalea sp. MJ-SS2]|nr:hypothetical protein [Alisedimentitalea sp. MJ-SS2]